MGSRYVTRAGDALDLICLREYGAQAGVVEQVLKANPHIKDVAHRFPAGVAVTLPDLNPEEHVSKPLRLWE